MSVQTPGPPTDTYWGSPPDHDPEPDPMRLSRRGIVLLATAFVAILAAALLAVIPLPYAVLTPGPAVNVLATGSDGKPLISVTGAKAYPASGALDFTTVSVLGGPGSRVTAWDVIRAWLSPSAEIFNASDLFPKGATSQQVQDQNAADMTNSQHEAVAVALRSLGYKVGETYDIALVQKGSPATGQLKVGDQIASINNTKIGGIAEIQQLVRAKPAGSDVEVGIVRDGKPLTVTVKSMSSNGVTVLGIVLKTEFDYPFQVTIDAGDVGGPSAGTMFALGIRDVLTPGDMTGGKKIAGTGTIDDAGVVGPIGGIRQKIFGAESQGARFFLAPADNCADLTGGVPGDIQVVKISTYDDAVKAVEQIAAGSTELPSCTR